MSNLNVERVLSVHHWNDTLFSFKTTRNPGLRFENGQFVMIGLEVEGRPLMRAYSIASPNYEEHLEFFSIKVPDGPLTSRLQHLQEGDSLMVSRKPTGTLILGDLLPGKHLYLLSTGTGALRESRTGARRALRQRGGLPGVHHRAVAAERVLR